MTIDEIVDAIFLGDFEAARDGIIRGQTQVSAVRRALEVADRLEGGGRGCGRVLSLFPTS